MDVYLSDLNEMVEFLDLSSEEKVRNCGAVLFIPVDRLYGLLDVKPRELWSAVRDIRKGLPTYKTAQKMFFETPENLSLSSIKKHLHKVPVPSGALGLLKHQLDNGYSVAPVVHWLGLLEGVGFATPVVMEYWRQKLYQVSDLSGVGLRARPATIHRFRMYASAEVVVQLGCPVSREWMPGVLSQLKDDEALEGDKHLAQLFAADAFSVLLRVAAWFIAEAQVANWDCELSQSTHDTIQMAWAIPKWCDADQRWSNPMDQAFEKLAKLAGWSGKKQKPVTYLGKLWAAAEGIPEASKIRLLRNWLQLKPSRPSFKSMQDLIRVCFDQHFGMCADLPPDVRVAYWDGACCFRFAETLAILLRDWQKEGWPNELIASMLSVYESEYRTARTLMGKPMSS